MSSVNVNYNVAMADGGGYVSSSNSASQACQASAAGSAADVSGPRDNSSISSFSGAGSDFDREGGLNTLYDKKAQAESQLSELKGQRDEAQSKIENRRQEIIEKRSSGEEAQAANDTFEALKKECTQKQQDKSKAQPGAYPA